MLKNKLYNITNSTYFWLSCLSHYIRTQIKNLVKEGKFLRKSDIKDNGKINKDLLEGMREAHIGWVGEDLMIRRILGKFPYKRYKEKLEHEEKLEYWELLDFREDYKDEYVLWKMKRNNEEE